MNNILPDRHRMMMLFAPVDTQPANEIWYTYTPNSSVDWLTSKTISNDNPLISNVYANGRGVLTFTYPVTNIARYGMSKFDLPNRPYDYSLKGVTLPRYVRSIGASAFYSCRTLISVKMPYSLRTIGSYAFYYCTSFENINFPDFCYSIGDRAFMYTKVRDIYIPDSVTEFGRSNGNTFSDCNSLFKIRLSDNISIIGSDTFRSCTKLKTLRLPKRLSYAYERFVSYSGVTDIIVTNTSSVIGLTNSNENRKNVTTLHVPNNLLTAYQNSRWNNFFTIDGYDPDSEYLQ